MYFSELTLKLIEEVKKREILYNTKYEKRPKPEKEEAWREVGANLNGKSLVVGLVASCVIDFYIVSL